MQKRKGFTLAEVLITLSIIGVVAALTIPAITASTNQSRARASVKKAVSVLNQALTLSIAQDGVSANSVSANSQELANIFLGYLSSLSNTTNTTTPSITTADGMTYTFYHTTATGCSSPADNLIDAATCIVEVDINGESGSEVISNTSNWSDLYYLIIKDSEVVPANANSANKLSISNSNFRVTTTGDMDSDVAQNALLN